MIYRILCMTLVLLLSGCFSPVKNDANTYQLQTVPTVISAKTKHAKTIMVMFVNSGSVYNTTQIAYKIKPYQVSYYSKNMWADTPSNMLESLLAQTLQNTHYYHAVVTPEFNGQYQYLLSVELLKLEQDFLEKPSVVRLEVRAQIIRAQTNQVIAAKEFSTTELTEQNTPYGGVMAANKATARILQELANFSLRYAR